MGFQVQQYSLNRPRKAAAVTLALATLMSGAQAQTTSPDVLKSLLNALTGQAASAPQAAVTNMLPSGAAQALSIAQQQQAKLPMSASMAALFAKGTVTGVDLVGTLMALRQELRNRKSAHALAIMVSSVDASVNNIASGNVMGVTTIAADVFASAATTLLKQSVSTVAVKALDDYLQSMIDDPQALAAETITLPSGQGLNEAQAKRIVTVAALVVGARVTAKLLERTKKDLEGLRTDYAKVLDKREQAAKLLFAAISERGKLQQGSQAATGDAAESQRFLSSSLSAEELAFLDKDLSALSVAQFSKDMAAQNLALGYLQKAKPDQFHSYRAETDDVVRRTKSYMRTMTGIAAFGALSVNFTQAVAEIAREKQIASLIQSLPLMKDFVVAAAPLAPVAVETAFKGVELSASESGVGGFFSSIFNRKKNFAFITAGKSQEMAGSKDVFFALKKDEAATPLFQGALFRGDAPGMLQRVGECDRAEAGRMFDATMSKSDREAFASAYFGDPEKADGFSFLNAFEDSTRAGSPTQGLAYQLLGEDHRQRSSDNTGALAKAQLLVSDKYDEWGDAQLMRLIFTNREGKARHATLYLGELQIRPLPSPESVYAYETAAESCKKLVAPARRVIAAPPAAAPAAATPAKKPAPAPAKPAPAPKKEGSK